MIPSVVAKQLKTGLVDYVQTTFPFANEPFRSSFSRYLSQDKSLCFEPYTAIRLPFKSCGSMPTCFDAVRPAFLPYVHQQQAFDRLAGDDGRSTLVASGTGSGKTECFLYPLIDYCYRHRNEQGIKALIVYPMNALATDQAERIAQLIYGNDKLRDNVTAGLYVGGLTWSEGVRVMGERNVITDRDTMIENPPDILLTNYKMLDYLLMRPHDSRIWRSNNPDTLKYIAVDEIHTFDGAQGTDLACLLRRLKSKLFIQPGHLCCVGTSATMGGEGSAKGMLKYARDLFGEPFDSEAVIQESRQDTEEFLGSDDPEYFALPDGPAAKELEDLLLKNDFKGYMSRAHELFFEETPKDIRDERSRVELGGKLKAHALFQELMRYAKGSYYRNSEAIEDLGRQFPTLSEEGGSVVLDALVALVSHARISSGGKARPFLNVQVQLWSKELRRLVASVASEDIDFDIAINLSTANQRKFLPVINCRDCGQTAWAGITTQDKHVRAGNLAAFYNTFFGSGDNLVAIYPRQNDADSPEDSVDCRYCPECGLFEMDDPEHAAGAHQCPECDCDMLAVSIAELKRITKAGTSLAHAKQYRCPCCASDQGLAITGLRGTTESEVALTQLFASDFDEDVRTLVFSDSVQDASHRAGFFNGRTWKFGLRAAMLEYLQSTSGRQSVAQFRSGFADFWTERLGSEEFICGFIAPNNAWMREYEKLIDTGNLSGGEETKKLLGTIKERMEYEVLLEIGMRSHIGRTMEKSAAIAVGYDSTLVRSSANAVVEVIENKHGVLLEHSVAEQAIVCVLQQMRADGAFAEPRYESFIRKGANAWLLNHGANFFMPSLRASGIPRFPLKSGLSKKGFSNWMSPEYSRAVEKCLPAEVPSDISAPDVVKAVFHTCCENGLLVKLVEDSELCSYALNESSMYVTTQAVRLKCEECGRSSICTVDDLALSVGSPCSSAFCAGHLKESDDQGLDYYGNLFSGGYRGRIRTAEHTGLLTRSSREEVEREFKAKGVGRHPWYPNVLSCTPTLEMGIDIGDLSSLVMCGMPPGQAQFLQRAGRAGRRDGNALVAVVANANAHGMYFYDEPSEMLEGNVEPPRVFLEAGAVLERQFTAYCLDRWTKETDDEKCIPRTMFAPLQNMTSPQPDSTKFPLSFLGYVKTHTNQLINSFLQMFSADFGPDSDAARSLRAFAIGGAGADESRLHVRVYDAFFERKRLRRSYQDQKEILAEIIAELKSHPADASYDEAIKEHEIEQRAVEGVVKAINDENVFGFMSREGLLPNYAFPEEGAHLRVVLRRKTEDSGQDSSRWERETQEYSRSASAAISEFAPGNTFYANGHHYQIDQVDLNSAKEEEWRLCPDCSYAELVTLDTPTKACPKCHSTGWADKAQRRKMLKLTTVMSNADYNESMSDDSSDAREITFFTKQLLVEVMRKDVVCAYKVDNDETDFGFEYVKRATLREINYGPADNGTAQESSIAGEVCVRQGFRVCSKCGKVQLEGRSEKQNHSYSCPVRRGRTSAEDAVEECLFLYREFETEAIRMLIPETSAVDITAGIVDSFVAAVLLGLKKKFGNVDHLSMTVSEEPIPESGFRKRYLVIYDSVPGGTGYLKQLAQNGSEFMSVLKLAYEAMEECGCKDDPSRDGCYRCLYAYRQSSSLGNISRKRAMEVLGAILKDSELENVSCLDEVDVSNLFDSALEKMFVDALSGAVGPDDKHAKCMREIVNGKPGYSLKVGEFSWEIEPQVDLGPAQGVSAACRPDFVLWPVGLCADDERKPIAVFTDGFEYHKGRIADDILKREAINRSGRFRTWSLSYKDVEHAIKNVHGSYYLDLLRIPELPSEALYNKAITGRSGGFDPAKESPFSSLVWYLGHSNAEEVFAAHAEAYSLGMVAVRGDSKSREEGLVRCIDLAKTTHIDAGCDESELMFAGVWPAGEHTRVYGAVSKEDVLLERGTLLFAVLDDSDVDDIKFQPAWNGCLDLFNLMQFFWGFAFVSKSSLSDAVFDGLNAKVQFSPDDSYDYSKAPSSAWDEVLGDMFGSSSSFGEQLRELGVPVPDEVGYELESGEQAELVWCDQKICFLTEDLLEDRSAFEDAGWRVIESSTSYDDIRNMFGVTR